MALAKDTVAEILARIRGDAEHFGGRIPERTALVWRGYLAALLEWDLISISQYDELLTHIPEVLDDPAVAILRGRD